MVITMRICEFKDVAASADKVSIALSYDFVQQWLVNC